MVRPPVHVLVCFRCLLWEHTLSPARTRAVCQQPTSLMGCWCGPTHARAHHGVCVSPSLPVLRRLFVCPPQSQYVVSCQSLPVSSPSFDETIRLCVGVWPEWPQGYSSQVLLCVNSEVCVCVGSERLGGGVMPYIRIDCCSLTRRSEICVCVLAHKAGGAV